MNFEQKDTWNISLVIFEHYLLLNTWNNILVILNRKTLDISFWGFLTRNTLNIILVIFEQRDTWNFTMVIFEHKDILLLVLNRKTFEISSLWFLNRKTLEINFFTFSYWHYLIIFDRVMDILWMMILTRKMQTVPMKYLKNLNNNF